jgi:hypothetical protein
MSFFQNPFCEEFRGSWTLSDRKYSPNFVCKGNAGRGPEMVTIWNRASTYNLSGNDSDANDKSVLTITYALDTDLFKNWAALAVDVGGTTVGATLISEVAAALNADAKFATLFVARVEPWYNDSDFGKLIISQTLPSSRLKFFIRNTGAETVLGFNARAGVAQLPTYFMRHTVGDNAVSGNPYRYEFTDAQNMLVYLDPAKNVDASVIDGAVDAYGKSLGYSYASVSADWELLRGQSGLFMFSQINLDLAGNIDYIIEYPAGAVPGDLAKKTKYLYDGGSQPIQITEEPYTLLLTDMVYPDGPP